MNATRTSIVAKGIGCPGNLRRYTLTLDQGSSLTFLGMLLAFLALWPISLGDAREYTLLTLAALLIIRSSSWVGVENDESVVTAGIEISWAAAPHFVFF